MSRALATDPRHATDWAREFERLEPELRRRDPAWLTKLRREAIDAFVRRGFPKPRDEAWRHTDASRVAKASFRPSLGVLERELPREPIDAAAVAEGGALPLVFVDGRYVAGLSAAELPSRGVRAGSLASFLASEPELVEPHLGRAARLEHPFEALNLAFFEDGAFVLVPRGAVVERPIHVLHVVTAREQPLALFPRSLVVLEDGAQATVVESHFGPDESAHLTVAATELRAGAGAVLDRYEVQDQSSDSLHFALTHARLERDASLRSLQLAFGAALSRTELSIELAGPGAESELAGLYVLDGEQRAECRTFVDHAVPHGTSRQDYRGILDGRSRGAFAGDVLVRPGAQKSDARQHNRNLVLSRGATADTKPELRIHADDVKCAHGATIGRLDDAQLFYLRARGIGEAEARRLLTRAFASAVLEGIRPRALRASVEQLFDRRLSGGTR